MCIVVLFFRCIPGTPVLLGACRDEYYRRPAAPPSLRPGGRGRLPFLAPRDEEAGGTWIGLNPVPAVGALTNRSRLPPSPAAPSRGGLCAKALASGGAESMARAALEAGGMEPYGGFNFLAVDERRAYLVQGGGSRVYCRGLSAGVHVLDNDHEVDTLPLPLSFAPSRARNGEELFPGLLAFLQSHIPLFPEGPSPCKHMKDRGTRSSTVIALSDGGPRFLHAPGPPCITPYQDLAGEAARLVQEAGPRS